MRKMTILMAGVIIMLLPGMLACNNVAPRSSLPAGSVTFATSTLPEISGSSVAATAGEVEASEFLGTKLTPIKLQGNNALKGTQFIDRATYKLTVDGLVDHPLSLSYDDLLKYSQIAKLMPLNCVEGWNFTAKWSGPALSDLFKDAEVKPEAKIVIFHSADVTSGYSSLELSYIQARNIILGLKNNDVTLTPERGFPFQVVAESKYGYKWAKWINRIELSSDTAFRGYWENFGYNNNGDAGGPAFSQ